MTVCATRVVADHAPQCTIRMGRRIGSEREVMLLSGLAHGIANHPGLYGRRTPGTVQRHDVVEIFREIDDDSDVTALPGETGAAATPQNGDTTFPTGLHGRHDIVEGAGNDNAH